MTQLLKVHGSQNNFFILDQTTLTTPLTQPELVHLAQVLANPKTGLLAGSDGLLVIDHSTHPDVLGKMQVINADGSIASMCGNGLRTVARYLSEKYQQTKFKVETMNADLEVRQATDFAPGVPAFAVEISPVSFDLKTLPLTNIGHQRLLDQYVPELAPGLKFSALAVPNPHLIAFVKQADLTGPLLGELGKRLNGPNPYFTDGVNINFAQILGKNKLFIRTYERGVGFTNACGTGMSATSLAFALTHPDLGTFDQEITAYNPGGLVKTVLRHQADKYWIELIGNATVTHRIELPEASLHTAQNLTGEITATGEQENYQSFVKSLPRLNSLQVFGDPS